MYHVPLLALITRFVGSKRAKLGIGRYRRDRRSRALRRHRPEVGQRRAARKPSCLGRVALMGLARPLLRLRADQRKPLAKSSIACGCQNSVPTPGKHRFGGGTLNRPRALQAEFERQLETNEARRIAADDRRTLKRVRPALEEGPDPVSPALAKRRGRTDSAFSPSYAPSTTNIPLVRLRARSPRSFV